MKIKQSIFKVIRITFVFLGMFTIILFPLLLWLLVSWAVYLLTL